MVMVATEQQDVIALSAIDFAVIVLVLYVFVVLVPKQLMGMMARRNKTA